MKWVMPQARMNRAKHHTTQLKGMSLRRRMMTIRATGMVM